MSNKTGIVMERWGYRGHEYDIPRGLVRGAAIFDIQRGVPALQAYADVLKRMVADGLLPASADLSG